MNRQLSVQETKDLFLTLPDKEAETILLEANHGLVEFIVGRMWRQYSRLPVDECVQICKNRSIFSEEEIRAQYPRRSTVVKLLDYIPFKNN